MANNKLPFGLCKKYHIDLPEGATPRDAWEALKENGIEYREDRKPKVIEPADNLTEVEWFPRSLGAMWANYKIRMPDGSNAKFVEGAKLERKEIIAGYKSARKIDNIKILCTKYPETTSTSRLWSKLKGVSDIIIKSGETIKAEVHWYQHPKTGKVDFKFKEEVDEG